MTPLLAELGGRQTVEALLAGFYARVLADVRLAGFFRGASIPRLHQHQVDFFCAVLGGADIYRGRNMVAAHARLDLGDGDFDAFAEHLMAALVSGGVPEAHRLRILGMVSPLRSQIVTRRLARATSSR